MGRRIRHTPFTSEQQEYILANHQTKTVKEITADLGIGYVDRRIYAFLSERGLDTLDGTRHRKRKQVPEGIFNEDERDWVIG